MAHRTAATDNNLAGQVRATAAALAVRSAEHAAAALALDLARTEHAAAVTAQIVAERVRAEQEPGGDPALTVLEAAASMGHGQTTTYELIRAGRLPCIPTSDRGRRIRRSACDADLSRIERKEVRQPEARGGADADTHPT